VRTVDGPTDHSVPVSIRGPLAVVVCSDRATATTTAEQLTGSPAETGESGVVTVSDIDQRVLPALRHAAGARLTLTGVDLASDAARVRLLKAFDELTTDQLIVLAVVRPEELGAPLLGRCSDVIHLPTPVVPHPWDRLGPIALTAATSTGATRDAFEALAVTDLYRGPDRDTVERLTAAIDRAAKSDTVRRAGGRAGVIDGLLHRIEQDLSARLAARTVPTQHHDHPHDHRGHQLQAREKLKKLQAAADLLSEIRRSLGYHPTLRPLVAAILSTLDDGPIGPDTVKQR
jgi:hypothetical protein